MLDLGAIRRLCGTEYEIVTKHCHVRLEKRGILISEVEYAIMHGEIIESYPDDFPFPSCLILCILQNNKPLHVVCSVGDGFLYLITAYHPTPDKFGPDHKTRIREETK